MPACLHVSRRFRGLGGKGGRHEGLDVGVPHVLACCRTSPATHHQPTSPTPHQPRPPSDPGADTQLLHSLHPMRCAPPPSWSHHRCRSTTTWCRTCAAREAQGGRGITSAFRAACLAASTTSSWAATTSSAAPPATLRSASCAGWGGGGGICYLCLMNA